MMFYNMADMYFVGWLGDFSQVASVSLAMPVFSILMAISTMIGNGGCAKIAQALGQHIKEQIRCYTALCVWASIFLGLLFAAAWFLFCNPLLGFLGANEEMWDYTKSYVLILAAGSKAVMVVTMIQMGICMGIQPLPALTIGLGIVLTISIYLGRSPRQTIRRTEHAPAR